MSAFDIRKPDVNQITKIQFDDAPSAGVICGDEYELFLDADGKEFVLCNWDDFDNFIAACHKAREIWGPKS